MSTFKWGTIPIQIFSNSKHSLKLKRPEDQTLLPKTYPPLVLRNGEFPYPPFTRYKWEIISGDASQVETNEDVCSAGVEEGGETSVDVSFSFKSVGNYKIKIKSLKEGYYDIVTDIREIDIEVSE